MTELVVTGLRVAAGVAAVCYAAYLVARRVRWSVPSVDGGTDADLRAVLDLAARFRAAGKPEAVRLCRQLLDELLKVPGSEAGK